MVVVRRVEIEKDSVTNLSIESDQVFINLPACVVFGIMLEWLVDLQGTRQSQLWFGKTQNVPRSSDCDSPAVYLVKET